MQNRESGGSWKNKQTNKKYCMRITNNMKSVKSLERTTCTCAAKDINFKVKASVHGENKGTPTATCTEEGALKVLPFQGRQ